MKHKVKRIHFVGIGGSGMSGIAEVLLNLGYTVSGSDLSSNAASRRLAELGASIRIGHAPENVDGADAIVTSTAVQANNPEVIAARGAFPGRRLVLAFQPHRYTRTRDLFEDFVKVLSTVDVLVLADVYPAGEQPIPAADGRSLAHALRVVGKTELIFVEDITEMPEILLKVVKPDDVVMTMGAGSISNVPAALQQLTTQVNA